jgi:hypothetical protein
MTRSGCRAGTRSSKSTYENNDPVTASDPRIAASRADGDTESDLRYPVPAAFFNGLIEQIALKHGVVLRHDRNYDCRILRPLRLVNGRRVGQSHFIEFAVWVLDLTAVKVDGELSLLVIDARN